MKLLNFLKITLLIFVFQSCLEDDTIDFSSDQLKDYSGSYLILNEGNFSDGVGTVSYIKEDLVTLRQKIFQTVNNKAVGSVLQSGMVLGDQIFLVVNNSNKIEIVDRISFQSISTIDSGLEKPRYITTFSNKIYVSNFGLSYDGSTNFVSVFDFADNSFVKSIPVATNGLINKIYNANGYIYAMNEGIYSPPTFDFVSTSNITVINSTSDELETTLTLSAEPNSAVFVDGKLFVLCSGYYDNSGNVVEEAAIWEVDGLSATKVVDFADLSGNQTATHINAAGFDLYFVLNNEGAKGIYKLPMGGDISTQLELLTDLSTLGVLSNFSILNNQMIVLDKINYSLVPGNANFYDLSGGFLKSVSVGIFPGEVLYNPSL